ncbi:MAG: DNA polymerase III subunit chi [Gammaproteobacteria bacterium]|jgi:DNA polymerase-3 subunit chi|nr:DNA polymerase III subunit chi [Gammaproteobacteria bacterium]
MRVDIYLLSADQQQADSACQLACKLIGKAWPAYSSIAVCCPAEQQSMLDDLLWQLPQRFIAHGVQATEAAKYAPVQIHSSPLAATLLINLQTQLPAHAEVGDYARILDIVGASAADKAAGRSRYRLYQQHCQNINVHQL